MRLGQKNGRVAAMGAHRHQAAPTQGPALPERLHLRRDLSGARHRRRRGSSPKANTDAMQRHLDEISRRVRRAVRLLDRAGWHTTGALAVPANITLVFLPPRSPELNPTENIWQYLRQTHLSNRVFDDYDDILEAACQAWNRLIDTPSKITSIGTRDWTHTGQIQ